MAKFKITPTTTVAELKEQYRNEVGGVLRVYDGRSEAPEDATLVSLGANEGELECRTSRTVGKFEEAFQKDLNLKVKVYTKGNGGKVLDGITLATSAKLPYGMTKAKMEEYLSYKRDEKEEDTETVNEETVESIEVPEEYKGLPIIEITTEEIDIDDPYGSFPSYPTYGIIFHGYESNGSQACVLISDDHEELCEQAKEFIENEISSDEDIPVRVLETKTIKGYGKADDIEEIKEVIGCALNEYYDGGNKHSYEYEWEDWFPNKAIFLVDDDTFIAYNNGGIDFINLSDEQLIALKGASIDESKFHDGLASMEQNGKWGFITKDGTFAIAPQYDEVEDFEDGYATVRVNRKWGVIDTKGKYVIDPITSEYYEIRHLDKDYFVVSKGRHEYGIVSNGKWVVEPIYDDISSFLKEGLIVVKKDRKCGYINLQGEVIIPLQFDSACDFSDGKATVELNDSEFEIDKKGNRIK
ncbi:MAG: WG repeat-containing protein [Bacteroidales bacterium]|nr:WG repeat-containing protein [Bacteroidales bacterium]MBD5211260.1 WG repeat-containing protein [Bacteroidales bacterium]